MMKFYTESLLSFHLSLHICHMFKTRRDTARAHRCPVGLVMFQSYPQELRLAITPMFIRTNGPWSIFLPWPICGTLSQYKADAHTHTRECNWLPSRYLSLVERPLVSCKQPVSTRLLRARQWHPIYHYAYILEGIPCKAADEVEKKN